MKVQKAGCILIDVKTKKVGLIFRQKQKDYSFPKGHQEEGETLEACAIRETAEETKRDCYLLSNEPLGVLKYIDSVGDETETYYYLARDEGASKNDCTDTHELHWIDFNDVEKTLSYQNLKDFWNQIKNTIIKNKVIKK